MEYEEYVVDLNAHCKCGCMDVGRFHKIFRFPNGYGASVISNPKGGPDEGGYTALLLRFTGPEDYEAEELPGFGGSTVMCGSWAEAVGVLDRVAGL